MCGLSGFFDSRDVTQSPEAVLENMGEAIYRRGPDAQNSWFEQNIGLVHRRLAIQDLSPAGAQPMHSLSGRYVLAFNGEIYNFLALRERLELEGMEFRGHSDTEVMLAAFEVWGISEALNQFSGMFAFALVDRKDNALHLARDRMGEKPLYYGWQGTSFLFGSELKALRPHPAWQGTINRNAITLLLRHNLIPWPHSIYEGIKKLPPAGLLTLDLTALTPESLPEPEFYWNLTDCFAPNAWNNRDDAADELEKRLDTVVGEQMLSDVPLGAFLSGGIDSSTIVAIMQKQARKPVKTFSIGFEEAGFNEAEHAKAVARHLKTDHTELYVSPSDGLGVIPDLPTFYDEPFADSSQIPTYLVSRMTREHVTVALSGDGGDELFCGYTRYPGTVGAWQKRNSLKHRLRRLASQLPPEQMAKWIKTLVPGQRDRAVISLSERLRQEARCGDAQTLAEYYRQKVSFWPSPEMIVKHSAEPHYALTDKVPGGIVEDPLKSLMWLDLNWYLTDDILVKVDRAAMACSLETRVPLLDRRIVEFALGLPTSINMEGGVGKQVLRDVLFRHVPRHLVERPKQGFAVPLAQWLRTSLRDWAENLLSAERLEREGFFHAAPVRSLWQAHLDGFDDHSSCLWGVLMFQAWFEEQN